MSSDRIAYLSESLATNPEWFWEWVEMNQKDENLMAQWFRLATPEQLLAFWKVYYGVILSSMPSDYERYMANDEDAPMVEDDLSELNNWVIVQGKPVWEALVAWAKKRGDRPSLALDQALMGLVRIFHEWHGADVPDTHPVEWQGVKWVPRDGFFPGDMADFIYEERFGITLWEQLEG